MAHLIDVSHMVEDGLVTYPGLPAPIVCDFLSREASRSHYNEGTTFQIGRIEMVANTGDGDRPVHTILLGAGIPIVEHLCALDALPPSGFRFHAVPVTFRGVGTFPVRAYAITEMVEER